ncbi:ATP-binding protein [Streptomyces sp. NPDC048603]|uniref:ATP-binding protein n=1 Tax=Streptomyces sp. NPDC048603 TaxID=3365577 RepID=UPI003720C7BB
MADTVTPAWVYTLQLPHDPRSPGVARATLRAVLHRHGMAGLADTAELIASELVTHAYRHSGGPSALRLRAMGEQYLRVGVWDTDPEVPAPFAASAVGPDGGRGLDLVRLCAERYGGYRLGAGGVCAGKLLWAECGAPERGRPSAC